MASNDDDTESIEFDLLKTCGESLLDKVELKIKTTIPSSLRKILLLNEVDSINILAQVDDAYKLRLENFVRNDLIENMIEPPDTLKGYLGIYQKCQHLFKFSTGQEIVLNMIVRFCKQLSPSNEDTVVQSNSEVNSVPHRENKNQFSSKDDDLKSLGRSLTIWIRNKKDFDHIRDSEFTLKVKKNTYQRNSDGSVLFVLKCPFQGCSESFKASYKSYGSSYKRKEYKPPSKKPPPKWHLERLHKHMLSPCPYLRRRDDDESDNDERDGDERNNDDRDNDERDNDERDGDERNNDDRDNDERDNDERDSDERRGDECDGDERDSDERSGDERSGDERDGDERDNGERDNDERDNDECYGDERNDDERIDGGEQSSRLDIKTLN